MARYTQKIICLGEIEKSFPYQCRYRLEDSVLEASIAKRGMWNPVLVAESKDLKGKFTVISGHKRFQAALKLGKEKLDVLCFEEQIEPKDLFLAAVFSNWGAQLEDLDIAYVIHQAKSVYQFSYQEILEELLPALGLRSEKGVIEEALLVFKLDPSVLKSLAKKELPYRGIKRLSRFSLEDQKTFVEKVVCSAKFSSTQLIYIADWLYDLLIAAKQSLAEFLEAPDYQAVLNEKSSDRRQTADKFMALIKAKKYPSLTQKQHDLEASIGQMTGANSDVSLEVPANLEDEGVILKARLRKQHSVEEVRAWLSEKKSALNSLFDIML